MTDDETFAGQMRKRTRVAKTFSDKFINLKFAMTIGTDDVYAETVLAFYEIFSYLERVMREQKGHNLGRLLIKGLARTQACVEDLNNYMGSNWVIPYTMRDSAARYIAHMERLYNTDPDLLIPYVYHLYMELLSGGQLLKTKKELDNVFNHNDGEKLGTAMVDFGNQEPEKMRLRLYREVNAIGATLDSEKKLRLINEGNRVFEYANDVLRSIESVDRILKQRLIFLGFCIFGLFIVFWLLSY